MIVIIAGSRACPSLNIVLDAIHASNFTITHVISGGAHGVDRFAEQYAARTGIPITVESANWKHYGNRAGPIRNEKMASMAQALIAVWNGESPGTRDMIERATQKGLKVYVHRF